MFPWLKNLSENPAEFAGFDAPLDSIQATQVTAAYRELPPTSPARTHLLRALAMQGGPLALTTFAELVVDDPPRNAQDANLAFVPLFQAKLDATTQLFPKLLDGLAQPVVAGLVLDLANHLTRRGVTRPHPAASRLVPLGDLLGNLIQRLQRIAEHPEQLASLPRELGEQMAQGIGLVISLCDALALIGDTSVVGKIRPALELGHRRLRTEAAAALARLGEKGGIEALVELAAQPTVRTRVLAYLSELGLLDRAPPEFRSPAARAEAEFVDWLSQPTAFGLQPQALELFDSRRQSWPGYSDPVDCFLFRYEYHLPTGSIAGVGIVGPVCNAFRADLSAWPVVDIYAAYAGWSAEHPEIRETSPEELNDSQREELAGIAEQLGSQGFDQARPALIGDFFGSEHLVFAARHRGQSGTIIIEDGRAEWFSAGPPTRPLEPSVAYMMFKGRRLIQAFDSSGDEV